MYVTLAEAKKHLNVDFSDDDDYIEDLISVGEASVEKSIQCPITDYVTDGTLNPMLGHAVKMIAANLYANREPVAFAVPQAIPYTLQYLITPFIKYT